MQNYWAAENLIFETPHWQQETSNFSENNLASGDTISKIIFFLVYIRKLEVRVLKTAN